MTKKLTLPRHAIARDARLFRKAKDEGERQVGRFLVLSFLRYSDLKDIPLSAPRLFAVIVPRMVGNAVTRNRVKRRVREVYRKLQHNLQDGILSIWIARKYAANASYHEFAYEIEKLYAKAGLLMKNIKDAKD